MDPGACTCARNRTSTRSRGNPCRGRAAQGVLVRRSWQKHLLTFLMVFGPGLIVMEADNDAGAVSTYMQAGGQYGLHLLWTLIVLLPICYFVQEMVARLGDCDRQRPCGHDLRALRKVVGTLFALRSAGCQLSHADYRVRRHFPCAQRDGSHPWISVPVSALGLTLMVVTGSYLRWERIVIALVPDRPDLVRAGLHRASRLGCRRPLPQSHRRCRRAALPAVSSFW